MIPLAHDRDEHNRLLQEPRSSFAEAYRSLRTALQFSTTSGVPKSLLITSSRPSEGKSSTAATLARNFAELGMRVLLIDADLRKPSLHTALGLGNGFGLTNCLIDNAIPPDVFQKTAVSGLTFMASGPLPPNPAELLAGPKMLSLLTVAAEKYDIVIVDSPPVGGLADAPLLANMVIGTLLVVDVSATHRGVARAAVKRLHFARAQMVGTVVNKVDVSHQGYGYAYGYGYSYGYGDAAYHGEESTTPAVSRPQPRLKSLLSRMGLQ
jgi:capsular exopolysaccharide synthesis family protein